MPSRFSHRLTRLIACLICMSGGNSGQAKGPRPASHRSSPESQSPSELSRRAASNIAAAESEFRRALLASLASSNPFERRLALERFEKLPSLVDGRVVTALVPRLAEAVALPPEWCLSAMESHGGGPDDQDRGAEVMYALCLRSTTKSEGRLAAELLVGRDAFSQVVAFVADNPSSVESVVRSLEPSGLGPASVVMAELASKTSPESQFALLRLAVASTCDRTSSPVKLDIVAALASSDRKDLARMAAIALVRLGGCSSNPSDPEPARRRALSTITARLEDVTDEAIVQEMPLLGPSAQALLPSLLSRFERVADDRQRAAAILDVIGAIGPSASPASSVLVRVLQDRKRAYLWRAAVRAIGRIGPAAGGAKRAILDAEPLPVMSLSEVTDTLSKIQARLDSNEFARLDARYRSECGALGPREVRRLEGDECRAVTGSLSDLAARAGQVFRPVSAGL